MEWIDRDRARIEAIFIEDVRLGQGYYESGYHTFPIESINGFPCPHKIHVWMYNDQQYIPFDSRHPEQYAFHVCDMNVMSPSQGSAVYRSSFTTRFAEADGIPNSLSIEEILLFAYTHYTNMPPMYYECPRPLAEAEALVDAVMGRGIEVTDEMKDEICRDIREMMRACMSDYAGELLCAEDYDSGITMLDEILDDVLECSGIRENGTYTESDLRYAIGRVLCRRLDL